MKENEVEVFFEEGQIMIEMHDISVGGHGLIRDPENGNIDIITFHAPVQTGNIII